MKPLKLTVRNVLVAALMLVVVAAAFDGLRRYNKMNAERNETSHQVQVEPAVASASANAATASL
ncbi:MAG: hypothetical protein WBW33_08015 [Bryobacteraceae bacterium]